MQLSEKEIAVLLSEACIQLGYCLGQEDRVRISAIANDLSPADLAREILIAEGLDPDTHARRWREMRDFCADYQWRIG